MRVTGVGTSAGRSGSVSAAPRVRFAAVAEVKTFYSSDPIHVPNRLHQVRLKSALKKAALAPLRRPKPVAIAAPVLSLEQVHAERRKVMLSARRMKHLALGAAAGSLLLCAAAGPFGIAIPVSLLVVAGLMWSVENSMKRTDARLRGYL